MDAMSFCGVATCLVSDQGILYSARETLNYLLRFIHVSETAGVAGLAAFTGYVLDFFVRAVGEVAGVRVGSHDCGGWGSINGLCCRFEDLVWFLWNRLIDIYIRTIPAKPLDVCLRVKSPYFIMMPLVA